MNKFLFKGFSLITILALVLMALPIHSAEAVSTTIVISQVYGGAGCGTVGCSTYKNDYIELHNVSNVAQSINGWSVQYASAAGTTWQVTPLSGSLAAGQYFLVGESFGTNGINNIPTADVSGSIAMSATVGKVALVNNTTALTCGSTNNCLPNASIIDFVGYGSTASSYEGTGPAPAPSTTNADIRGGNGCTDTDTNASDFTAAAANPRNSASATFSCPVVLPNLTMNDVSLNEGNSGTTTFTFTVSLSAPAGAGGVTFDIATADGTATTADADYVSNSLTSQTIPAGSSSSNFDVLVNGDTTVESNETFFVNVTNVTGATVTDGQGQGTIQNDDAPPGGNVVISQVYGGGGNTSAPYKNDFVELYNRSNAAVDLTGWSVQYASATGSSWQVTTLSGSIQPGNYYLVSEAAGTSCSGSPCGVDLPTPNASGNISMGGTAGKVALANNSTAFTVSCPTANSVDFVGYGTTANCYEGTGPAPAPSNTTADLRAGNGATDTDNNAADFTAGSPNPRNTPPPLNLSINDVSASEGDTGTTAFNFTVSLSRTNDAPVTFDIATADDIATSPSDFTAVSLTGQTIPAGSTTYNFSVLVNGDTAVEPNETFFVNVTNVTVATVVDGQGVGTINNDDSVCTQSYTPIYSIQGSGSNAAITGTVTTQGVVVGDFEGTAAASGFYLQDLTGDGDATTSDGIFVYTGSSNLVSAGQLVRVTGYARERFNQTTLNGSNSNTDPIPAANIASCGTSSVAATDVTLPFDNATFPERYEGMLVRLPQSLVIAEYFNYDRFGEIVLAQPLDDESRPFTGTAIDEPGAAANARTLANSLSRITLDDVQSTQNPAVLRHPNGQPFSLTNLFRGGDTVQNTVGVLGFDFNLYRIYPTGPADYTAANPRPASPEPVGGSLRVAAMNTLNFFVTADYPSGDPLDNKCGPANTLECRGWDSDQPTEFTRQRDKLLTALSGLNGDIIGLNELENSTGVEPLASIVSGMPGYAYINTGTIGTDAIKVGLIYRPSVVTPIGTYKLLTSTVDPRFIDTKSRPSLAQTFEVNATGARFTVVVNHLKSKGSACDDVGDPDLLDGQGNCSQTRRAAAEALVDWLATDPTGSGDPDFIIMGDLNSYAMEDTIDEIKAGSDDTLNTNDDFTNLIAQFQGTYAYSYTFDGQAGYLDHALAIKSLLSQVTGATEWHINSDEPDVLDYDTSFKPPAQDALYEVNPYRTSDHDAVVVGLNLINTPPVANNDNYSTDEDTALTVAAPGVLANDSDPENHSLTAVLVSGPSHGTLTLNADGSFSYTPASNYNGSDSFTYKANDGTSDSNAATVNIAINAVNDAPVANDDNYSTNEDTTLTVAAVGVLANDTDVDSASLTAVQVTGPAHGTLTLNANGSFTYTPAANYNGPDSFTYKANDGSLDSNIATVSITVNAVNDTPVATNNTYSTNEDITLSVAAPGVLGNDLDVDGDSLTAVLASGPAHGNLTLNANGSFSYTPAANYNGSDSFTYRANDGTTNSNLATVSITITAVNDVPVAVADSATVAKNGSVTISILTNDFDVDGDTLTVTSFTQPAHGSVAYSTKNKNFRYTPTKGFTGTDTFTYTISDGHGGFATATVTITVQ